MNDNKFCEYIEKKKKFNSDIKHFELTDFAERINCRRRERDKMRQFYLNSA